MNEQRDFLTHILCCPKLLTHNNQLLDSATVLKKLREETDVIGIYISGSWCTPCQKFTKILMEFTKKLKEKTEKQSISIILISCDKTAPNFLKYFQSMNSDWYAVPYEEKMTRRQPIDTFKISSLPSLIILESKTGKLLTENGVHAIKHDPHKYPWIDYTMPWYYSPTAFSFFKKFPIIIIMILLTYINYRGNKNGKLK